MAEDMKIKLIPIHSEIFIFDDKDWEILRKEYRIIGKLVGSLRNVPVLPLKLMPEEVHLLLEKGIGKIVKYAEGNFSSADFESKLLNEEVEVYKNNRKRQLEGKLTEIVASKRKKGDTREESEIFNEVLSRSSDITKDKMIWPLTSTPMCSVAEPVDFIPEMKNNLKYCVFKDLWEKGYYITSGEKFGGDFLVYKGDPITHHALFIVRCVEETENMMPAEITAFGRLATAVKKGAVLASLIDDEVSYITLSWIDD